MLSKTSDMKIIFIRLSLVTTIFAGGIANNLFAQADGQAATPSQLVDALHTAFGDHHSRAVHAKGIIFEGNFTPGMPRQHN